jgi:uncharacterized repeat protein (TIGR01451 family)
MPRFRIVTTCLLLTVGLFLSCTDGDGPVSFEAAGLTTVLQIQPVFPKALLSSADEAKPINLIRVTVKTDPGGTVVNTQEFKVSPNAASWEVPVEIPLSDNPDIRFVITIELVNSENGVNETQWSAQTAPLTVTAGATPQVREIEVVRGPVENLEVLSLTITGPGSLLQGEEFQLKATVQTSGRAAAPTVFWSSLTPEVASLAGDGSGRALAPGVARLAAVAGPVTATHEFEIIGVASDIIVTPETTRLTQLGQSAELVATVVDSRGVARNETVSWTVEEPRVVLDRGNGIFEAVGGGESKVTATGVQSPELSATVTVVVDLAPVRLEIRPSTARLTALGQEIRLEAVGIDAQGTDVFGVGAVFLSENPEIATVDAKTGVVTAVTPGRAVITATSEADASAVSGAASSRLTITASAVVTVVQEVDRLVIEPLEVGVDRVGATVQFTATAFDSEDNVIPRPQLTWRSGDDAIATVDENGLATSTGRGSTKIFVESGGVQGSARLDVDILVATVAVVPPVAFTGPKGTVQFEAELRDDDGKRVDGLTVVWESSNPEVAIINRDGLATGGANGETRITANFAGLVGTARMFVQDLVPTRLAFKTYPRITAVGEVIEAVEVVALTDDGRLASTYNGLITISLDQPAPAPGAVQALALFEGTMAVNARSGVAVFSDLIINEVGTFILNARSEDQLAPALGGEFSVVVPTADLAVTKSVSPAASVGEGGELDWLVTVTNNGPFNSKPFIIFDNVRTDWALDGFEPSVGEVVEGEGTEWRVPNLGVGESATLTIRGFATGRIGNLASNIAGVLSTTIADPDAANDVGVAKVEIAPVDIAVTKTVDNQFPLTGDQVTFTVTVENVGPVPASGIVIQDMEQPSFSILNATVSAGSVDQVAETWTIPVLDPGEAATLKGTVEILAVAGDPVSNTATLIGLDQTDGNAANDAATVAFAVNTAPTVPDVTRGVQPNTSADLLIPISDADADDIIVGAIVSGPSNGRVSAVTINSNTEAQFTYIPGTGFVGSDRVTLTVTDEHGATSSPGTVDITVATGPVPSSYETGGNTELITGDFVRPGEAHVYVPDGVLGATPGLRVTSTGVQASVQGGQVDLRADGGFSYRPPFQFKGTDTFQFTVGSGQTETATIVVTEMIWYVNNLAGPGAGTGTSWDPFGELIMAQGSVPPAPAPVNGGGGSRLLVAGPSEVNDVIFVHAGDGTSTGYDKGITLLTRQSLFAEGTGLIADGMDGAPNWGVVVPAGAPPVITNPLGAGVELATESDGGGFVVDGAATGVVANGVADVGLFAVAIRNTVGNAIEMNGPVGNVGFDEMEIDTADKGIMVSGGSAMINFSGTIANTTTQLVHVDATTGGDLGLFAGPFTWSAGGGVLMTNATSRVQVDDAKTLPGADRAVQVTNSTGDLFMNGLEIDNTNLNAIDFTNYGGNGVITLAGGNFPNSVGRAIQIQGITPTGALTIDGMTLIEESGSGFRFTNIDGHLGVRAPTIVRQTGAGIGVEIVGGAGTIDMNGLTVDMTGNLGGAPPGGFDARYAEWDSWVGAQGAAINISSPTGTITFTDVDLNTDNEPGLLIVGNNAGNIRVTGSNSRINTVGGDAVSASGVNLDMVFADVTVSSSSSLGINLQNTSGTFSASGGSLVNNPGTGVRIFGGSTMFNYGGSITTPVRFGRSVVISNSSGSATFDGLVQELGLGILLSNNPSARTSFNGGLNISASEGTGFEATNGGEIEVTGPGNTIDALGQIAIDLNNTPLGPAGVTFESISADGSPTAGISIVNPPAPPPGPAPANRRNQGNSRAPRLVSHPGFTVTGTGGLGSGGLIKNSGGSGVSLTNTRRATLNSVDVQSSTTHGVNILDPRGRVTIDGARVTGNGAAGVNISNNQGSGHVVVQNSTVSNNGTLDSPRGSGVRHEAIPGGTGATTVLISNNTLSDNPQAGIDLGSDGTQTVDAKIEGNTIERSGISALLSGALSLGRNTVRLGGTLGNLLSGSGGGAAEVTVDGNARTDFVAQNNTVTNNGAAFVMRTKPTSGASATLNSTVSQNTITGGTSGGISNLLRGSGATRSRVSGNSISNLLGGSGSGSGASGSAKAHLTITGNTISMPAGSNGDGIQADVADNATMCLQVGDPSDSTLQNDFSGGTSANKDISGGISASTATLLIPGIPAGTTSNTVVENHFLALNPSANPIGWTITPPATAEPGTCELPPTLPPFTPLG